MNRNIMIGLAVALVIGMCSLFACVGIVAFVYQDELQAYLGLQVSQKTATLLPENTQFYLSMTPNIQAIPGYENLKALYLDNPEIIKIMERTEKEATKSNISFKEDVQPWLGTEVVIAIPEFATTLAQDSAATAPDFIISAQTRDKAASDKFIDKVLTEPNQAPFTDEAYQGITLHLQQQSKGDYKEIIVVSLNDLVIIATDKAMVKDMIDRSKGSNTPSFVSNAKYSKIVSELPSNTIATMYMETFGLFEAASKESAFTVPDSSLQDMRAFEAVGIAALLQPNGIQVDMAITYNTNKMSEAMKTSLKTRSDSPNAILQNIPAEALVVLSGSDLNKIWQNVKEGMANNPDFESQMTDMESEMGFSLDKDVFGWMTGEYAMVLVDAPKNEDSFLPRGGGYVLIGSKDIAAAKTHVATVADAMQEQMGPMMTLKTQTIAGIELTSPENPLDDAFLGGYGFQGDYFLTAYREEAVTALANAKQNPFTNQANFKALQSYLPAKNTGYIYANLDQLRAVMESDLTGSAQTEYETNMKPFLKPVHAIGSAASTDGFDKGVSKGSLFLLISE